MGDTNDKVINNFKLLLNADGDVLGGIFSVTRVSMTFITFLQ